MTWKKGESGNPAGKPKGTRHRTTIALESLLDGEADKLARKAIQMALAGDAMMLRLCIERVLPARKDRPIAFDLPPLKTTKDASKAMFKILEATSRGELTPAEAAEVGKILENFADTVRLSELEQRISEMEQKQ